jgi:thiamine-monophosphate kinase
MNILNTQERKFLEIIKNTLDESSFLGDDCAHLKEYNLTISHDTLVENVHFDLNFMSTYELGKKAVIVNLSDILASGAKPSYITVSLSGPLRSKFVQEFFSGVNEMCKKYNVKVIGGDLTKGVDMIVSICAFGNCEGRLVSSRKNAKPGYVVGVKGVFGSSAWWLKTRDKKFKPAHFEPVLYPEISSKIAKTVKKPYAMMDSSDGLLDCLAQIAYESDCGLEIEYDKIPKEIEDRETVLYGGEDFSLVFCLDKEDFKNLEDVTAIGTVVEKKGVFVDNVRYSNEKWEGYKHFG